MNGAFADEAFETIAAGETVEVSFDAAELHDLTTTGDYDFVASGVLSYANVDSNEVAGVIPYSSNTLTATVDGAQAAESREKFVKRTVRRLLVLEIDSLKVVAADEYTTNRLSSLTALAPGSQLPETPSLTAAPLPLLLRRLPSATLPRSGSTSSRPPLALPSPRFSPESFRSAAAPAAVTPTPSAATSTVLAPATSWPTPFPRTATSLTVPYTSALCLPLPAPVMAKTRPQPPSTRSLT